MPKISFTSTNNDFFLITFFVIFRVFNRKRREYIKFCYLAILLIVIFPLKFQIQEKFPFNFNYLQKCPTNDFETLASCHYIKHIILHKN